MALTDPALAAEEFMGVVITATMGGLNEAGIALKKIVRQKLAHYLADSKLIESVDYRTSAAAGMGSRATKFNPKTSVDISNPKDQVPLPEKPMSLSFGAGHRTAGYVEKGTAPHTGSTGNATPEDGTFEEKMFAWGERYGFDKDYVENLIAHIAEYGTEGRPFMVSVQEFEEIVTGALQTYSSQVWSATKLPDFVPKRSK